MCRWSALLVFIVVTGFAVLVYFGVEASQVSPMRELHMVEVEGIAGNRLYTVFIPARYNPGKTDQHVVMKLCIDGDDLPLKPRMVMRTIQFYQRTDCMLINENTFVGYLRDEHNNVVDKFGNQLFVGGE